MKERPILFSGAMVRAVLDGSKMQTRRVVRLNEAGRVQRGKRQWHLDDPNAVLACPYGQPGDRLWVREAYRADKSHDAQPPRDIPSGSALLWEADQGMCIYPLMTPGKLRPSMFMPRWASRITLEITDVRVERLQDISEADAIAEGINASQGLSGEDDVMVKVAMDRLRVATPTARFVVLWDSINGTDSWSANPWVWVVEFRRID